MQIDFEKLSPWRKHIRFAEGGVFVLRCDRDPNYVLEKVQEAVAEARPVRIDPDSYRNKTGPIYDVARGSFQGEALEECWREFDKNGIFAVLLPIPREPKMTEARRNEIAYTILLRDAFREGKRIGQETLRGIGNLAKDTGISSAELKEFSRLALEDLLDLTFKQQ